MGKKEEKKFSKAEMKRKEDFEKLEHRLIGEEGYEKIDLTMTGKQVNLYALITPLPFMIIFGVLFVLLHRNDDIEFTMWGYWLMFGAYILCIAVHEALHGITWAAFCPSGFKAISFGFNLSAFAPYCTCSEPVQFRQHILAALMPTIWLGLFPCVVSLFTGSIYVLIFGILGFMGGGGDFMIVYHLLQYNKKCTCKDVLIIDHPFEIGTVVFQK